MCSTREGGGGCRNLLLKQICIHSDIFKNVRLENNKLHTFMLSSRKETNSGINHLKMKAKFYFN